MQELLRQTKNERLSQAHLLNACNLASSAMAPILLIYANMGEPTPSV